MSWWWVAPLVVAAIGAGLLVTLAQRAKRAVALTDKAAEGLATTVADLRAARQRLVVDLTRYRPPGEVGTGRPVQQSPQQ